MHNPGDVNIGDRVRADVKDSPNGGFEPLPGEALEKWAQTVEKAAGYVKRIGGEPGTTVAREVIVLRHMRIIVTPNTEIIFDDPSIIDR